MNAARNLLARLLAGASLLLPAGRGNAALVAGANRVRTQDGPGPWIPKG